MRREDTDLFLLYTQADRQKPQIKRLIKLTKTDTPKISVAVSTGSFGKTILVVEVARDIPKNRFVPLGLFFLFVGDLIESFLHSRHSLVDLVAFLRCLLLVARTLGAEGKT